MFCPKCGNQLPDNGLFCPNCGNPLEKKKRSIKIPVIISIVIILGVVAAVGAMITNGKARDNNFNVNIGNGGTEEKRDSSNNNQEVPKNEKKMIEKAVEISKAYIEQQLLKENDDISIKYLFDSESEIDYKKQEDGTYKISYIVDSYNNKTNDTKSYMVNIVADSNKIKIAMIDYINECNEYLKNPDNYDYVEHFVTYDWNGKVVADDTDGNYGELDETTDNVLQLSNGLKVIFPEKWTGKYESVENNTSYSVYEKTTWESDSEADGCLFYIVKIMSCEELEYFPEHKILGVYEDSGEKVGLIISYPTDVTWDENNSEATNAYQELSNSIDEITFDTSDIKNFIECDEANISDYLPESLN